MKRSTGIILILAGLIVLVIAFLTLDFRLMQAELSVDSSASTSSATPQGADPLPLGRDLDLYVEAPPGIAVPLTEALAAGLASNPYVGVVTAREGPLLPSGDAVMVVLIDDPSALFWSPFYTRTLAEVDVAYASDGEVAWIDEDVVVLESTDPPTTVKRVRAEHTFDGSAYGLISGPGYANYLAREMTQTINQSLSAALGS